MNEVTNHCPVGQPDTYTQSLPLCSHHPAKVHLSEVDVGRSRFGGRWSQEASGGECESRSKEMEADMASTSAQDGNRGRLPPSGDPSGMAGRLCALAQACSEARKLGVHSLTHVPCWNELASLPSAPLVVTSTEGWSQGRDLQNSQKSQSIISCATWD